MWTLSEEIDLFRERGEVLPYIPRDIDREILTALEKPHGFVLIIGRSADGKTRTAYEMLLRHAPDLPLLVPRADGAQRLEEVIEAFGSWPNRPIAGVLWLDDLQNFFGSGGLTVQGLRKAQNLGLCIVATIRRRELEKFQNTNLELNKVVQDLYDRAHVVQVPDGMSANERVDRPLMP